MNDNVVSFGEWAQAQNEMVKEKIISGIDRHEVNRYYDKVINVSIQHLSLLERYLIEGYLGEIIIRFFMIGAEASKQRLAGRTPEEIETVYSKDFYQCIYEIAGDFRINRHVGEWDAYSVSIMAEDLSVKWFRKGLEYGERQRKMRLL
jgi:hypothetical protein